MNTHSILYWRIWCLTLGITAASLCCQTATANDIVDFLQQWGQSQNQYDSRRQQWSDQQRDRYRVQPTVPEPAPAVPFRLPVELSLSAQECGLDPGHYDFALYGGQQMHLTVTGAVQRVIGGTNPTLLLTEANTLKPHVDVLVEAVRNVDDRSLYRVARSGADEFDRVIRDLERSRIRDAEEHFGHFEEDWTKFVQQLARYNVGYQLRQHLESIQRSTNRMSALFRDSSGSHWDYDRPRLFGLSRVLTQKVNELKTAYVPNPTQWQSKALNRQLGRVQYCANAFAEAVRDNASFETLVDEYRIFDDAWQFVLARSGQLGQYTPQMVAIGRDIWEINSALADVLLIDPPAFSDQQAAEHVVSRFYSSARRLEREIELANLRLRERGFSSWGLTQECDRLRRAAHSLNDTLQRGQSLSSARTEVAELSNAWRQVLNTANSTARTRLPSGMTDFLTFMDRDFRVIESSAAGDFQWRYASIRRP